MTMSDAGAHESFHTHGRVVVAASLDAPRDNASRADSDVGGLHPPLRELVHIPEDQGRQPQRVATAPATLQNLSAPSLWELVCGNYLDLPPTTSFPRVPVQKAHSHTRNLYRKLDPPLVALQPSCCPQPPLSPALARERAPHAPWCLGQNCDTRKTAVAAHLPALRPCSLHHSPNVSR